MTTSGDSKRLAPITARKVDGCGIWTITYNLSVALPNKARYDGSARRIVELCTKAGHSIEPYIMPNNEQLCELIEDTEATDGMKPVIINPTECKLTMTAGAAERWGDTSSIWEKRFGGVVLEFLPDSIAGVQLPDNDIIIRNLAA